MTDPMVLVANVKRLCKERNIFVSKMEEDTNIGNGTVYKWRNYKTGPRLDITMKIADYFGVTLDSLVGREVDPPKGCQRIIKAQKNYIAVLEKQVAELEMIVRKQTEYSTKMLDFALREQKEDGYGRENHFIQGV